MKRSVIGMKRSVMPVSALLLFAACNAILGNEDNYTLAPSAEKCERTEDCSNERVCVFETCQPRCSGDPGCPVGSRCMVILGETACIPTEYSACVATECPAGTFCRDGQCRNTCENVEDCLGGQSCRKGVCIGNDPRRDPAASTGGSGGAGGQAGSGGAHDSGEAGTGIVGEAGSGGRAPIGGGSSGGTTAQGGDDAGPGGAGAGGDGGAEPCVPRGAEDCLNGVDDDCNGQLDCADAACEGPTECVPEARGAELGTLLPMGGACPAGYSPVTLHRELVDSYTCQGCSCRPTAWRCQSGVYGHGSHPCPSFQFATQLYNLFTGQCNLMPADPSLHYYPVSGFTECAAEGTGTPTPPTWGETRTFCKADRLGRGCPSGQRCVRAKTSPSCAMTAGETSCDARYPDDTGGVFNTGFTDDRACPCSCSFGSADCSGGYIEVYSGGSCTGTPVQMGSGAEADACPLGFTPQSARIIATPTSPSCPSNAFPIGEPTLTDPRTVCCAAP